jgi:hypothetical protein
MTNEEFIKHLEYEERIMRELHGVKVAMPFKVALEAARAAIAPTLLEEKHVCGDWGRATGATPEVESGRDGWK